MASKRKNSLAARIEEEADPRLEELRGANARLSRALEKEKIRTGELVRAVYQAAHDAATGLTIPPVPKPKRQRARGQEEVAVPLLSDLQLAKITPDYDTDTCAARVDAYADKIIELTELQRTNRPVKRCHVAVLGDVVEGELIFPGQSFLIDGGLYRQITVDGPQIICNFLRKMLANFDTVHVTWVIGNHGAIGGRGRRDHDPETNGDRMLGRICQQLMEDEERLTWTIPDGRGERNWYAVLQEGKYKALCIHGDQIRGHSGFPWYGLSKKVNGWASGAVKEEFQDVLMGHWHQIASIPLNKRSVFVNGSTESFNTYAQENLAAMSDPAQWLLFVNPNKGRVTAEYKVWLS